MLIIVYLHATVFSQDPRPDPGLLGPGGSHGIAVHISFCCTMYSYAVNGTNFEIGGGHKIKLNTAGSTSNRRLNSPFRSLSVTVCTAWQLPLLTTEAAHYGRAALN